MRRNINYSLAVFFLLLSPWLARADVWVPPWGESIYDSTFITVEFQDSSAIVEIEVHSAVMKLVSDDYVLTLDRMNDLGEPFGNPAVIVSDSLIQTRWVDGQLSFTFLSQTLIEDTLFFTARSSYRYPLTGENGLRRLSYGQDYIRYCDDPAWGFEEFDSLVFESPLDRLGWFVRIKSNIPITARDKVYDEDHFEHIWSDWSEGCEIEFQGNSDYFGPWMPIQIELNGDNRIDGEIEDSFAYELTPEVRVTVPNIILDEEVSVQLTGYWNGENQRLWSYQMLADIRLEPELAVSLAPMWLWFPNDQTEEAGCDLAGLFASGGWGAYSEVWTEDTLEIRNGTVAGQNGFYIHVPGLEQQVENPNDYWWWSEPHLRVSVRQLWNEADSCRFILITAPIQESVVRFTLPEGFEFCDWSSPFEEVEQGNRGRLGSYLAFTGLCREPGVARVVWRPAQSAPLEAALPAEFAITSVAPNPFNNRTTINYTLPEAGNVQMDVVDLSGRSLHSELIPGSSGENSISLDATDLPAGIYWMSLGIEGQVIRTKVVCLK